MQPTSNPATVSLRRRVYNFLLNDQQSEGARSSLDRFLFLLILLNLFALLLESSPVLAAANAKEFYWFDVFSVGIFSVEYLLRIYLAPEDPEYANANSPRWAYISSALGIVDLLAILPFFIGLLLPIDSRVLRVLRALRILKITRTLKEAIIEFRALNQGRTTRQKVHAMLFPSEYGGKLNVMIEVFLTFWIVASVLSIVLESVESIRVLFEPHFAFLDVASFIVFAIEYSLRIYAAPEEDPSRKPLLARYRFFSSFSGLLDLFAILPFILELAFGGTLDLRFLRIVRMVRLLKLGRYSTASDTMFAVIGKELPVLIAAMFMITLLVFMMAAFGFLLERDAQPDKFENIPQSIYWAIITLASVGYGDISPITPGGRFITVVLALIGIGIFAIPAAILASGFTDQLRSNRERIKQELLAMGRESEFDANTREEFFKAARQHHLSNHEINEMIKLIEQGEDPIKTPAGEFGSLTLAAENPAYALAQYRMLVARMSELSSVVDNEKMGHVIQQPGQATELERSIWEQLNRSRPKF